jgi:hypothetical protein
MPGRDVVVSAASSVTSPPSNFNCRWSATHERWHANRALALVLCAPGLPTKHSRGTQSCSPKPRADRPSRSGQPSEEEREPGAKAAKPVTERSCTGKAEVELPTSYFGGESSSAGR